MKKKIIYITKFNDKKKYVNYIINLIKNNNKNKCVYK